MSLKEDVDQYEEDVKSLSAFDIVKWAVSTFDVKRVALSSSLSIEDQVLTHMLREVSNDVEIFTIDTGRLPQESFNLIEYTQERYDFTFDILFPDFKDVESIVKEHGPNLFYKNLDLRKKCCHIRKVVPLQRKLKKLDAWVCGLRRAQSNTRGDLQHVEWDNVNGLVKINPLASWNDEDLWSFIHEHDIPYSALYKKGYASVGCVPCTRPIAEGDDVRAGRWWWEDPEHKECGLHRR